MNMKLFDKLMKKSPAQTRGEWQAFLEICEIYLKKHKIKNPIVVELGIYDNYQKIFYEKLLKAEHIGIDSSGKHGIPDIQGYTHDPKTLKALERKLNGRPINILFIDASHRYRYVKKDFEIYSPLCSDIVAFHDVILTRLGVRKFWEELKTIATKEYEIYKDCLFISLAQYRHRHKDGNLGIGMLIKK